MSDSREILASFVKAMLDRDVGKARKILHAYIHRSSKQLMKESVDVISEAAPPDMEEWVKSNKAKFKKEYGNKKGLEILYATAWKMHDKKLKESEIYESVAGWEKYKQRANDLAMKHKLFTAAERKDDYTQKSFIAQAYDAYTNGTSVEDFIKALQ